MKVVFIGDIVGSVGRKAVKEMLPIIKKKWSPDFIIANGENAAAGRGITKQIAKDLFEQGIHGITMGNHTWDNKDIFDFIDEESRMVRPANFPEGTPGRGAAVLKSEGKELAIINLQGRTFLPPLDCPFAKAEVLVKQITKKTKHILVDFHAEATSEKIAMGWHLDGKVSAVVGTHTHVQSHDERILPLGTAYITDVGMVGPRDGILGMERSAVLQKFRTQLPVRFNVDEGKWHFHAVFIELHPQSGLSQRIELIRSYEDQFIME
ncbi:TIGR00282 family metallophosphoesterase [Paenibacillus sp. J2TS4]|uniref:TIGR00282 family metallophosphoesterase n=1 Tax=Paenibacillus sp. J2TS4 TaxID=2807194 RepID=UPI001BCC717F|nr:TIGR00282 family metallophosphoesterase [Paenibacillus sp. J2TS4]